MHGLEGARLAERSAWAVASCQLEAVLAKRIQHCSKGYRQRLGVAAALIHDPPVVLLDEPTHGLDPLQVALFLEFVRGLAALRRAHPELRRDTFLKGALHTSHARDVSWWHASGHELVEQEWNDPELRTLGIGLGGTAASPDLLLLLNPTETECEFKLPSFREPAAWDVVLDTAHPVGVLSGIRLAPGPAKVGPNQAVALKRVR